jgi:hypothetical protein
MVQYFQTLKKMSPGVVGWGNTTSHLVKVSGKAN